MRAGRPAPTSGSATSPPAARYLASRADGPDGAPGDDESYAPALDADGTRVAFASTARNLGDGDPTSSDDIYVRDLETGTTFLVSRAGGTKGNGYSWAPDINAAGTRVAFASEATNLDPADAHTDTDAYANLRDITGRGPRGS